MCIENVDGNGIGFNWKIHKTFFGEKKNSVNCFWIDRDGRCDSRICQFGLRGGEKKQKL